MMQFLKSILSGEIVTEPMKIEALKTELDEANLKIELLEERLNLANESLSELSSCVKHIALATQTLSQDMAFITEAIKQVTMGARKENDFFSWRRDDDEYLN